MDVEHGTMGQAPGIYPFAATGSGPPVVVLAGASPGTGLEDAVTVRTVMGPVRHLADRRRIFALNRRRGLPEGLTMSELAAEHASAFRDFFNEPVDLVGISTGGSIAQQVAAEHPDVVRRLVLISTGYRLGTRARQEQAELAALLRAGEVRRAGALFAMDVIPWLGPLGRGLGWAVAPQVIGGRRARADLAATLEAEDGFDLSTCAPVQAPTLIVGGEQDRFYDAELFRRTAALIPGSTLRMIPRRGHLTVAGDRRARAHLTGFLQAPSVT